MHSTAVLVMGVPVYFVETSGWDVLVALKMPVTALNGTVEID